MTLDESTYVLRSMRTLRFTLVARAGRLARIGGRQPQAHTHFTHPGGAGSSQRCLRR